MRRNRYCYLTLLPGALALVFLAACSGNHNPGDKTLTVQGSDTMEKMVRAWSSAYMKAHPDAKITVQSGDTGIGVEDLVAGKIDIAAASRELTSDEHNKAHAGKVHLSRTMVAKDAVAIIVGAQNPVTTLTMTELKGIFAGEIKKWSQIKSEPEAGDGSDILVLGREASSGTADYLREHILAGKQFGAAVKLMPSSEAVIEAVEKQKEAVGFVGMSQAERAGKKVKVVTIKLNASSPDQANDNSLTGSDYPLERPLYLYSNTAGSDLTKAFVQFCQSEEGQAIVKDMGFLTVR